MILRLLAISLTLIALSIPASAETPDIATLAQAIRHARYSRAQDRLAVALGRACQSPSLEEHHRAPDRGAGRIGARRRGRAAQESDAARRHGLGRDRRGGLLGGVRRSGADPYRRRRPQRQQIHRQQQDLSPGQQGHLDRRRVRRQLSRRDAAGDRRRRSMHGGSSCRSCARATTFRSIASMRTTGSTSRTSAIARAARWRRWRGSGGSDSVVMRALDAGITSSAAKTWIAGTSPAMNEVP